MRSHPGSGAICSIRSSRSSKLCLRSHGLEPVRIHGPKMNLIVFPASLDLEDLKVENRSLGAKGIFGDPGRRQILSDQFDSAEIKSSCTISFGSNLSFMAARLPLQPAHAEPPRCRPTAAVPGEAAERPRHTPEAQGLPFGSPTIDRKTVRIILLKLSIIHIGRYSRASFNGRRRVFHT